MNFWAFGATVFDQQLDPDPHSEMRIRIQETNRMRIRVRNAEYWYVLYVFWLKNHLFSRQYCYFPCTQIQIRLWCSHNPVELVDLTRFFYRC